MQRKRAVVLAALVACFVLLLTGSQQASANFGNCFNNPRSDLAYIDGSAVCAFNGGGCTFCSRANDPGPGSWQVCYFSVRTGTEVCVSYM